MEARRCTIHGLVAADDGRCVICRRGDAALEAEIPPPTISGPTMIIVAGGVALMALFIYGLSNSIGHRALPAPNVERVADKAPVEPPAPPSRAPSRPRTPSPDPTPANGAATASPRDSQVSDDGVVTEDPKLTAAKQRVPIKMYTTPWCTYCKPARTWLIKHNYRFTELDIEQSETDKVEMASLNPAMTTPTFDVGGLPVVGFEPQAIDSALTRVASARLR